MAIKIYMDESYDKKRSDIICVAGYIFKKLKAKRFAGDWTPYLARRNLPYFHMVDCKFADGVFKGREDCDDIARKLIKLTRRDTAYGFAVTVHENDYNEFIKNNHHLKSAYTFALLEAMVLVRRWMEKTSYGGTAFYYFEKGHEHEKEADAFFDWFFESEEVARRYRYRLHAPLPKETVWLHPADMLAWQWHLEVQRREDPKRKHLPRKDLMALVRDEDMTVHFDRERLIGLRSSLDGVVAKNIERAIAALSDGQPS